jgi:hypothetical protein
MNVINEELYYKKYNQFLSGELTEQEWNEYCHAVLEELLEENKDVLIRLKNFTTNFVNTQPISANTGEIFWRGWYV